MNYDELSGLPYPKNMAGKITLDLKGAVLSEIAKPTTASDELPDGDPVDCWVEMLGLTNDTVRSLRQSGIHYTKDLVAYTESKLISVRNLDEQSINEIKATLADRGLSLKQTPQSQPSPLNQVNPLGQTSIRSLGLTGRTINCLRRARIILIDDLTHSSESDLMKLRNFGEQSLNEIKVVLSAHNLALRDEEAPASHPIDVPSGSPYAIGTHAELSQTETSTTVCEKMVDGKDFTISLYELISIEELGVRGSLVILGLLDIPEIERSKFELQYPSNSLPYLPLTLLNNQNLANQINRSMAKFDHANFETKGAQHKDILCEELIITINDIYMDSSNTQMLDNILVPINHSLLPLLLLDQSVEDKLTNGSSLSHSGPDQADVWEYVERKFSNRTGQREVDVLRRRWELKQILESIAKDLGVTRERIRQIESKSRRSLKKLFNTDNQTAITNRLNWVENEVFDSVEHFGGYVSLEVIEDHLGWPKNSVIFWFTLNSDVGLINNSRTNLQSRLDLGRIALEQGFLSTLEQYETGSHKITLPTRIQDIVGPSRIMRLNDLLTTLNGKTGPNCNRELNALARGKALERKGYLVLLQGPNHDDNEKEIWVAVGVTRVACEIARAILYGPLNDGFLISDSKHQNDRANNGLRTDLITEWLDVYSTHKSTARAIDEVCKRFPDIFAKTGLVSWGLIGAGAENQEELWKENSAIADVVDAVEALAKRQLIISKNDIVSVLKNTWSNAWVNQAIDWGLEQGYLVNTNGINKKGYALKIGTRLPEPLRLQIRRGSGAHGELLNLVITVLKDGPSGLSENQILRKVRNTLPEASADSVYVYLNHSLKGSVDRNDQGNYRLSDQYLEAF